MEKIYFVCLFLVFPALLKGQSFQVGKLQLFVEGKDENFSRRVNVAMVSPSVYEITITLRSTIKHFPKPITINFKQPSIDIQSYLVPYSTDAGSDITSLYNYKLQRTIPVSFAAKSIFTSALIDQPSITLINANSENRLTLSASELIYPVTFKVGQNESGNVGFDIRLGLFDYPTKALDSYQIKLRIDTRNINYNAALQDVLTWWKIENKLNFAHIPLKAFKPFYCTWYALKDDGISASNVEGQAALASKLGCQTIIVDDGWQKARGSKEGYCLYNGDWEPDTIRFPNFKAHVKKVQEMGFDYMLWIAPAMIGEKSRAYQMLKDKMLYKADWASAWVVDPRYPEVRRYLSSRLIDLMEKSGIDGFKIDFLDLMNSRYAGTNAAKEGDGRDYQSIEEAAVKLIADIYNGCHAINPEVLIEFRQFYTSPLLQQYANMFRAIDCPNDLMENRTRTLDARTLNYQVIHADPLIWNENERPEDAALQLLHTFLSVPQVSADLTKINTAQLSMIKFLLGQWSQFSEVLTRGKAYNYGPDAYYSWSEVSLGDQTVIVAYQPVVLQPRQLNRFSLIVNGTHNNNLIIDCKQNMGLRSVHIYDCTGQIVKEGLLNLME